MLASHGRDSHTVDLRLSPRPGPGPTPWLPPASTRCTIRRRSSSATARIERRYEDLTDLFPGVALFYAVKSNPMPEIVETLARRGAGFEIASVYELDMLTRAGVRPAEILFSNTVKPAAHIAEAARAGL